MFLNLRPHIVHSTGRSGAAGVIVEAAVLMPLPATEFLGLGEPLV